MIVPLPDRIVAGPCATMVAATALLAGLACPAPSSAQDPDIAELVEVIETQRARHSLQAVLVDIRIDGVPVLQRAWGESMTGVPATLRHHLRNGAVGITYVAALALRLAEDGRLDLDAPIADLLPDLPDADAATPRMLVNMTAGYPDHVADAQRFAVPFVEDPFRHYDSEALIGIGLASPRLFAPGANWDYSHTGYVILGRALEAATGTPLAQLLEQEVVGPLGLGSTSGFDDARIPEPALHAFTAERGIWEDSSFWNPSWTLPAGAIQVSTISDIAESFEAIVARPGFLAPHSHRQMIDPVLIGFGAPLEGCRTCHTMDAAFSYGLGVMLSGDWVYQTPLFGGYASAVATLPADRNDGRPITIAVAATFTRDSQPDWSGDLANHADTIMRALAQAIIPGRPFLQRGDAPSGEAE